MKDEANSGTRDNSVPPLVKYAQKTYYIRDPATAFGKRQERTRTIRYYFHKLVSTTKQHVLTSNIQTTDVGSTQAPLRLRPGDV